MRVENPAGLYPGAVWPCFYTGVWPTRHGRYSLIQIKTGTYWTEPFDATDVKREAFWECLGRAGHRIAVIDVPKARLTANPNVTQVADWGTHDPERAGLLFWPDTLAEEVVATFGRDPVGLCDSYGATGKFEQLRDRLLERVAKKEAMLTHFLKKGRWDLLVGIFSECHCAGHHFWHLHDVAHPKHDPQLVAALGNPLRDVYRAVDAALGRLIAMVGSDVHVLVYSSHGMGPHYDGTFLLDEVLRRLDGVAPPPSRWLRDWSVWLRHALPWRHLLPTRMRLSGRKLARELEESTLVRDRRRRTYFQIATSSVFGGIRINLRGREPEGKIAPGAEYEALCNALAADLKALTNAKTGQPAVRAVYRTDHMFPGEYRDDFPDILVEWNTDTDITSLASPKIGDVRGANPEPRTGDHRANGLLIACGPGLVPGEASTAIPVVDIAPTIAAALGVDLDDVDGRPIPEIANLLVANSPHAGVKVSEAS